MDRAIKLLRSAGAVLARRGIFFLIGAGVGYAYGYGHASANEPSLMHRALSIVGVTAVNEDHVRRQQAIDSFRQARIDSIESMIHR